MLSSYTKSLCLDSICTELIINAGAALKSWLCDVLFLTQNFQNQKKSVCSLDPKADEAYRGPKKLSIDISALCLLQDPSRYSCPTR